MRFVFCRKGRRPIVWTGVLLLSTLALALAGKAGGSGGTGLPSASAPRFAVGEVVVSYTDPSRRIRLSHGRSMPRRILTVIRYPALGDVSQADLLGAPAARSEGPFPLLLFGHGFGVTPAIYARLLRTWAAAGYVVAAPFFPLTNRYAPGGPDEADLVNQPADMSLVITRMLAADAASHGTLAGLIAPDEIAVSGQSDGGSTALAVAYNAHFVDRRIEAAIILSGARIPGLRGYFTSEGPPLLAVQGTADDVNFPSSTYEYYRRARAPKFLLSLPGAPHLGPYTTEQPQLGVVERTSIAFLDRYLKQLPGASARMWSAGDVASVARLTSGHG